VEYMGMAGCGREACDLGTMIVVMLNVKVYRIIFWDFYLVYGHAYAAL